MSKYPITCYNKHINLKVNELMLAIFLFLLKPYILEILSIANRKDRSALINMFYTDKLFLSLEAAAAIPLLLLIYAWTRRAPGAPILIKNIWSNGKKLIMITAFLQLLLVSSPFWLPIDSHMTYFSFIQLLLYILIIIVTYYSNYMRDCFADFPEPDTKP